MGLKSDEELAMRLQGREREKALEMDAMGRVLGEGQCERERGRLWFIVRGRQKHSFEEEKGGEGVR